MAIDKNLTRLCTTAMSAEKEEVPKHEEEDDHIEVRPFLSHTTEHVQ